MEYTAKGKVVGHQVTKDDAVLSCVRLMKHQGIWVDVLVPLKFPLASQVFVTFSDKMPEGGAEDV